MRRYEAHRLPHQILPLPHPHALPAPARQVGQVRPPGPLRAGCVLEKGREAGEMCVGLSGEGCASPFQYAENEERGKYW